MLINNDLFYKVCRLSLLFLVKKEYGFQMAENVYEKHSITNTLSCFHTHFPYHLKFYKNRG